MADGQRTLTANFTADTSGFSPKVNELIQKLKTLNQDFEQNKSKVRELSAQLKEYEKELKQLNSATNNGANANAEQRNRMQQLRDSIAGCNTQIGTYRAAQTALRSEINSTNRELSEQQNAFAEASGAATTFGDVLKANLASDFIRNAIREIVDGLRKMAAYCYQVGSSFEAGMSKVAAVSGASAAELEQLTAKAKELGSSTKFTATETAEAMNYMAMAGWKTQDMLSGIDGVLGLAAASGTDLATTSDIVTDALTAFGLKAKDCAHFADVLAAASSNANTNVSMMGETFKYCAPIAGSLGFAAEDVAVNIGLMANSGIKASQAGTAMRTLLTKLSSDLTITSKEFGDMVIKTSNADGSMRGLSEIIADLRAAFSQLSESERATAADSLVGAHAMSGFLALMNAGEQDIAKLTNAIENCDGAASAMADTMQSNVQGAVTKFNSALEGVGVAVYDKFKDGLADAVNIFTEALSEMSAEIDNNGELGQSFESLADSFKSAATEIASLAKDALPDLVKGFSNVINFVIDFRKEIGAAVTGFIAFKSAMAITGVVQSVISKFNQLKTAINAAKTAQNSFSAAMSATPWGLVAAGIGLIVGVASEIAMHANDAAERIKDLRDSANEAAQSAEEHANKAKSLEEVKKQYDEIYSSEKTAAEKSDELKRLQDLIIGQCPELKDKIDLVTGAYSEQSKAIQEAIDKQNEWAKNNATVAYNEMKTAETDEKGISYSLRANETITGLQNGIDYTDTARALQDERVQEILKSVAEKYDNFSLDNDSSLGFTVTLTGDSKQKFDVYNSIIDEFDKAKLSYEGGAISKFYNEISESAKQYGEVVENNKNIVDEFARTHVEAPTSTTPTAYAKYGHQSATDGFLAEQTSKEQSAYALYGSGKNAQSQNLQQELSLEERKKLYDKEKQLADDRYSVGEIAEEEYYNTLTEIRDKYLDEKSHEWYQATAQINSFYDKWKYKAKETCSEVQSAYKATLAAIDKEYENHKRKKSDLEFQNKIDEIDKELQYGRVDEFERYELEKKKKQLVEQHDEELYSRSISDAKSAVTEAYNARQALEKADLGTREYTRALGDYTDKLGDLNEAMRAVGQQIAVQNGSSSSVNNIDESTKNNFINVMLQGANKSISQIIDELMKALKSGI